jgi:hypothetical protein
MKKSFLETHMMKRSRHYSKLAKKPRHNGVEEISNNSGLQLRRGFWVGDFIGFACESCMGASGSKFVVIREGVKCLLKLLWDIEPSDVLAFREARPDEMRKSRCHEASLLTWKDWRVNRSQHIVVLVRRRVDLQLAELMISTSIDSPLWVECVDLRRMDFIRFWLWISISVKSLYNMNDNFVSVWCDNVIPLLCLGDAFFMAFPKMAIHASLG